MATISSISKCVYNKSLHFIISGASESDQQAKLILPSALVKTEKEQVKLTKINPILSVCSEIEQFYSLDNSEQFVGGMGETDGGVWIAAEPSSGMDTLDFIEDISEISRHVKQSRHGIKFGVYSSGLIKDSPLLFENLPKSGISMIKVSLLASSPVSYGKLMNSPDSSKAFSQVCGFIAAASESGFKITAAITSDEKSAASNLAKALGAVDVIVYEI